MTYEKAVKILINNSMPSENTVAEINEAVGVVKTRTALKQWFDKIDWDLLRNQKTLLVNLDRPEGSTEADHCTGLLNLLDSLQDLAVDSYGMDEKDIYLFTNDDAATII